MNAIDKLLVGAVDLHCHSGPSPMPRRFTHLEAARRANEVGMRAILVKCHYHNSVFDLLSMQPGLARISTQVFGGVALNSQVGGINPHAVDLCLRMGGRMIWFPTISSAAHLEHAARDEHARQHFQPNGTMQSEKVDILAADGNVLPEVRTIIDSAKESGALISAGHLPVDRIFPLLSAVRAAGHDRFVISHPNFIINASHEQAAELVRLGATIEHEIGMYDGEKMLRFELLLEWIELIGPEHTTLASDLGQVGGPLPVDAYRRVLGRLLDSGISERDVRQMIAENPARLVGLD